METNSLSLAEKEAIWQKQRNELKEFDRQIKEITKGLPYVANLQEKLYQLRTKENLQKQRLEKRRQHIQENFEKDI